MSTRHLQPTCNTSRSACTMYHATCNTLRRACSIQHATCNTQRKACSIQHAICNTQRKACSIQHAAYSTQHATHHVNRTTGIHHRAHPAVRHLVRSASFVGDAPESCTLEGMWRTYRRFSRTAKRCKSSKRPCGSPPPCFSALDRAHTTASLEASRLSWQAARTRRGVSHATGPTVRVCMVLHVRVG